MEGEAAGSAGKLARLASKSPPLSPTMAKRLTELRWLLETSAPVALTVRMAQRHGIARQELMMLQEDGYILVTKRQGAGSPQITFLAPGRDATAKVARASEAVG
jgi:hypothetical protein